MAENTRRYICDAASAGMVGINKATRLQPKLASCHHLCVSKLGGDVVK